MKYWRFCLFILFIGIYPFFLAAQNTSNKGTDFWTGYMGHIDGTSSNMSLYITSDVSTSGSVSIPGKSWSTSFTVSANSVTVVNIPQSLAYMNCSDCILSQGIHIKSVEPIVVFAHIYANSRSDATLVLPTETAGRDYYAMSFTQKVTGSNRQNEFMIVGLEDSTFVDIVPTAGTLSGTHTKGITYTKMLMQGQVYQVQSDSDLTATRITSYGTNTGGCKRIAVFSGSSFTPLGCSSAATGDNLFQQMYPASAWGKVYITAPMKTRNGGDYFRALASVNNTKVTINGTNTQTLQAGQYYEWSTDLPQYIVATEGICLAQYQRTQGCDNITGDPSMVILNSVEQQLTDITLYSSPYQNITGNYINIYMESKDTATFHLDNIKPTWKTIPSNTQYAYAQETVASGNHHLYGDSAFNAIAYGFGNVESYSYSAGANIKNQSQEITLKYGTSTATCKGEPVYFKGICAYVPVEWKWTFGDGSTDTGQYPAHTFSDTGIYIVSLVTTKGNGNDCESFDSTTYKVHIYSLPIPKIRYANPCSNEYIKFYDSSTVSNYSISSRLWDFGDGVTSSNQYPTHRFNTSGNYTVKLTVYSTGNCYSTDSTIVFVKQSPLPNFYFTDSCIQDSVIIFDSTTLSGAFKSSYSCFSTQLKWGDGNSDYLYNSIGNHSFKHQYGKGASYTLYLITSDCNTGCKDSISKTVSIEDIPKSKFSLQDGCQKDSVMITDSSNIVYGKIVKWNWDFGDGGTKAYTSKVSNFSKLYTNEGIYTISLITQNADGCADTLKTNITINPEPHPGFSAQTVCLGDTTFFVDTSIISSGNIASRRWYFGDGKDTTIASITGVKKIYSSAGTYSVKLFMTSDKGCIDSMVQSVTVVARPSATFSLSNGCEKDSLSIVDNSTGTSISNRFWSMGNGDTLSTSNTNWKYLFSSYGSYTVKLKVTTANGCVDSSKKTISIYELPISKYSSTNVCNGDTVHFQDSSSILSGTISKWRFFYGNGDSSIYSSKPTNIAKRYLSSNQYITKLITESNFGCRDTFTSLVEVHQNPMAKFSSTRLCLNDTSVFIDSSIQGKYGIAQRIWSYGDGKKDTFINTTQSLHKYLTKNSFQVTLLTIDSFGCKDSAIQTIFIDTVPVPAFSYIQACASDSIKFDNSSYIYSTTIKSIFMYWDDSTRNIYNGNLSSFKHKFAFGGYKNITLTAESIKGCKDSLTKKVYINPIPVTDFSLPNICYKDSVIFVDQSTIDSGSIVLWQFKFGDGDTTTFNSKNNFKHKYISAGTYQIQLRTTSNLGCIDSVTLPFTVNSGSTAAIGWLKPCLNDSVYLIDSSFIAIGKVYKWKWNFGDSKTDTIQNPLHLFADTGIYQLKLFVQSGNLCTDSATKNIHIRPAPIAKFSANNQCIYDSIKLIPSSTVMQGTIDSSFWDFGDSTNFISFSNTSIQKLYASYGQKQVRMLAKSSFGCIDTDYQMVTIFNQPLAGFFGINKCLYDTVQLNDSALILNDSIVKTVFYWNDGDSSIYNFSPTSPKHLYKASGTYLIRQIVISNHQCIDTAYINIAVHPIPSPHFTVNDSTQCFNGHSVTYTDTSSIAQGLMTRRWILGDGNQDTSSTINHQYSIYGNYIVSLILISDSGCIDSTTSTINIYESPQSSFTIDKHGTCLSANQFMVADSSIYTSGIYTRNWLWGDGKTDTSATPSHQYTNEGNYIIKLILTSNKQCQDSTVDSILVYPQPKALFNHSQVCAGNAAIFYDLSTITNDTITEWEWDWGDGSQTGYINKQDSLAHIFQAAGIYKVKLKLYSNHGCVDSIIKSVTIYEIPISKFTSKSNCVYNPIEFSNQSSVKSTTLNFWIWNWGDGIQDSVNIYQTNQYHQYATDGFYQVQLKVISSQGCIDSNFAQVQVYPKPQARLSSFADICQDDTLFIVDSSTISLGNISKHYWSWGDLQSDISLQSDTQHIYKIYGDMQLMLITESNYGCLDTLLDSISIHSKPVVNLMVPSVCSSDSISITDLSYTPTDIINKRLWDFGNGDTLVDQNPSNIQKHLYNKFGIYHIQLTAYTNAGCSDTSSTDVYILPSPRPMFTASEVCFGDTTLFTNNTTIDSGTIVKYKWIYDDGVVDSTNVWVANHPHYYTSDIDYHPILICESDLGCINQYQSTAIVHPIPVASFKPNKRVGCEPMEVNYTNLSKVKRDSLIGFYWDFWDGEYDTLRSPKHIYKNRGLFQPKLTVMSDAGCTNTWEDTIPIIVNELPVADFVLSTDMISTLNPQAYFVNTSVSATRWYWDFGDHHTSTEKSPKHIYTDTGWYEVMQISYNPYNCADTIIKSIYNLPQSTFFLSNSFTPNGDDLNETWGPDGLFDGIRVYKLTIWNRWGEQVFRTENVKERWNGLFDNTGKLCTQETYIFRIDFTDYNFGKHIHQGVLQLLR